MSDSTPGAEPTPEPTPASTPAGTPAASGAANDAVATLKQADRLDLGIIGAGLVAFIASLLPYYTWSVDGFPSSSSSLSAWHGFFGWVGAVLAIAAAGLLLAKVLGLGLPLPVRTTVLGLFAAALLCTLLALVVRPGPDCDGILGDFCDAINEGHGFGYWLTLLATIAGTALAFLRRSAD